MCWPKHCWRGAPLSFRRIYGQIRSKCTLGGADGGWPRNYSAHQGAGLIVPVPAGFGRIWSFFAFPFQERTSWSPKSNFPFPQKTQKTYVFLSKNDSWKKKTSRKSAGSYGFFKKKPSPLRSAELWDLFLGREAVSFLWRAGSNDYRVPKKTVWLKEK